jgi:hypothetical protein
MGNMDIFPEQLTDIIAEQQQTQFAVLGMVVNHRQDYGLSTVPRRR